MKNFSFFLEISPFPKFNASTYYPSIYLLPNGWELLKRPGQIKRKLARSSVLIAIRSAIWLSVIYSYQALNETLCPTEQPRHKFLTNLNNWIIFLTSDKWGHIAFFYLIYHHIFQNFHPRKNYNYLDYLGILLLLGSQEVQAHIGILFANYIKSLLWN